MTKILSAEELRGLYDRVQAESRQFELKISREGSGRFKAALQCEQKDGMYFWQRMGGEI